MRVVKHLTVPVLGSFPRIKEEACWRNKFGSLGNLVGLVNKIVIYRLIARAFNCFLVRRIADYRIELLSHSCCLTFQCGELEGLAVLPVVYHTEGNCFSRFLFFGLFGCLVGEYDIEQVEKRRLYRFRLGFLERPQGRFHLGAHLVGGHGVGEAVHLPEVPGYDPCRLFELILLGVRPPAVAEVFCKRLEHVDASDEQVVALVLEAICRTQRIEGSTHPLLASLGLLGHDAKLAV